SWVTSEWMSRPEPRPGEEMVAMVASISGSGIHECARLRIRETQHLQGDFARDAAHDVALAITHDDDRGGGVAVDLEFQVAGGGLQVAADLLGNGLAGLQQLADRDGLDLRRGCRRSRLRL